MLRDAAGTVNERLSTHTLPTKALLSAYVTDERFGEVDDKPDVVGGSVPLPSGRTRKATLRDRVRSVQSSKKNPLAASSSETDVFDGLTLPIVRATIATAGDPGTLRAALRPQLAGGAPAPAADPAKSAGSGRGLAGRLMQRWTGAYGATSMATTLLELDRRLTIADDGPPPE